MAGVRSGGGGGVGNLIDTCDEEEDVEDDAEESGGSPSALALSLSYPKPGASVGNGARPSCAKLKDPSLDL